MFNSNASSADAGGADYIEDVFSTWLYTGNGSTQTITNGIDLAGEGGLVWIKWRSTGYSSSSHRLYDTVRGATKAIASDLSDAETTRSGGLTAFNSNGFSLGNFANENGSTGNYASWTFRKQPKFFDVVTYTGNGASNREIAHNLGSTPGCIMVKRTDASGNWHVYHVSLPADSGAPLLDTSLLLNSTSAALDYRTFANSTFQTDTIFKLGNANIADINASGGTYVAYLFAHDAGGFGLTGTDNVISCGSYAGNGSTNTITLGYEPQFIIIKGTNADSAFSWYMYDSMRGIVTGGDDPYLFADTSGAEDNTSNLIQVTATGFQLVSGAAGVNRSSGQYIYIAIRRGPMKVPTDGTSVYEGTTRTGTGAAASISGLSFPPDAVLTRNRTSNGSSRYAFYDKLRGPTRYLDTAATDSEFTVAESLTSFNQTGESFGTGSISNFSGDPYINWQFRRAPGFFDEVCYTGDGAAPQTTPHNLGVAADLMIVKRRDSTGDWGVYYSSSGGLNPNLILNSTAATGATYTDTLFANAINVLAASPFNISGATYVAYLFATCPGVSKVGSYTGTAATQVINCGFTGGARFVLIKRTDSTGDWYVWDSARGIVAGNDPYLLLNSTAAEVTSTDYVDTAASGFELTATAPAAINASGGSYIFLAIA